MGIGVVLGLFFVWIPRGTVNLELLYEDTCKDETCVSINLYSSSEDYLERGFPFIWTPATYKDKNVSQNALYKSDTNPVLLIADFLIPVVLIGGLGIIYKRKKK